MASSRSSKERVGRGGSESGRWVLRDDVTCILSGSGCHADETLKGPGLEGGDPVRWPLQ